MLKVEEKEKEREFIKCKFEDEIIKIRLDKKTTFEEIIELVEGEWGRGKGIKYEDEEGEWVTMRWAEELGWVWEETKKRSVKLIVFSKGNEVFFFLFFLPPFPFFYISFFSKIA